MSSSDPPSSGGSRYLYEPFVVSTEQTALLKLDALEQVQTERWKALEFRLGQIDQKLERVERRVWLTIFGVAAAVLRELAVGLLP